MRCVSAPRAALHPKSAHVATAHFTRSGCPGYVGRPFATAASQPSEVAAVMCVCVFGERGVGAPTSGSTLEASTVTALASTNGKLFPPVRAFTGRSRPALLLAQRALSTQMR
eukprot:231750-Chlamydomonas_euryale.AAC.2